jgi:hypothetical protein
VLCRARVQLEFKRACSLFLPAARVCVSALKCRCICSNRTRKQELQQAACKHACWQDLDAALSRIMSLVDEYQQTMATVSATSSQVRAATAWG